MAGGGRGAQRKVDAARQTASRPAAVSRLLAVTAPIAGKAEQTYHKSRREATAFLGAAGAEILLDSLAEIRHCESVG